MDQYKFQDLCFLGEKNTFPPLVKLFLEIKEKTSKPQVVFYKKEVI